MVKEYNFVTVDAKKDAQSIQRELRRAVGNYLSTANGLVSQDAPVVK